MDPISRAMAEVPLSARARAAVAAGIEPRELEAALAVAEARTDRARTFHARRGEPRRRVLDVLAGAGADGLSAADVGAALGISRSAAQHHLDTLRAAGQAALRGFGRGSRWISCGGK